MLQYAWTQTGDATVTLSTPAAATTTFTAPTGLTADVVLTFTLRVTDAGGLSAGDTVAVTVVRGGGGGGGGQTGLEIVGPTSFTVVEGETAVGTLMATDADTPAADLVWSPAGGADSSHFTLDERGVLRFAVPKDYEAPDDAGRDGTYELTVQVSDGTDAATVAIRVALANRNEAPTANAGADQSRCAGRRDRHPARRWGGTPTRTMPCSTGGRRQVTPWSRCRRRPRPRPRSQPRPGSPRTWGCGSPCG